MWETRRSVTNCVLTRVNLRRPDDWIQLEINESRWVKVYGSIMGYQKSDVQIQEVSREGEVKERGGDQRWILLVNSRLQVIG